MAQVCITERLTRTDAADPMAPRGFYLLVKTVRVRISHRTREASALLDKTLLNPKKRTTDQKGQKPRRQTKTLWKRNCACDDFNHAQFSLINHRDGWFIRDGSGRRNCPNWLKFRSQHFLRFVARNNACRICLLFFREKIFKNKPPTWTQFNFTMLYLHICAVARPAIQTTIFYWEIIVSATCFLQLPNYDDRIETWIILKQKIWKKLYFKFH